MPKTDQFLDESFKSFTKEVEDADAALAKHVEEQIAMIGKVQRGSPPQGPSADQLSWLSLLAAAFAKDQQFMLRTYSEAHRIVLGPAQPTEPQSTLRPYVGPEP